MKRSVSIVLALMVFAAVNHGCARAPGVTGTITILVPQSIASLPFLALVEKKPLPGVAVKIEYFSQHAQALVKLLRGDAVFLFTGTTQGWESYWGGNRIVIVSSYVWGISSLLVKDQSVASLRDLAGKKISLPFPNSPLDVKTRFLLERAGLAVGKDVLLEYHAFTQAIPLFLGNAIDAIALPEPLASELVLTRGSRRLFEYRTAWGEALANDGRSPEVSLFATRTYAKEYSLLISLLHQELARMCEEILSDPKAYARQYSEALGYSPSIIEAALAKTSFRAIDFHEHKKKMLEYFSAIKPYFSEPTGELDDGFFVHYDAVQQQGER